MYKRSIFLTFKRFKHGKTHWKTLEQKTAASDKALENFDDFYGSVYGNRWKSMRIALLTEHKYIALVNNFGDVFETIESLEKDGAFNVRQMYFSETNNPQVKNLEDLKKNVLQLDKKMDQLIQSKEQKEISSIYPTTTDYDPPSSLRNSNETTQTSKYNQQTVNYKKSLDEVLKDDSELDYRRIVDATQVGTAALHEFIPASKIKGMEDWVLESDHYKYYSNTVDFPMKIELETELQFSDNLNLYTYEPGNISDFLRPKSCKTGVLSHFLMNGASILPPIALNVQPGERVLDACAAPGGKTLILLQTMWPGIIVCNDVQESRVNRIKKLMNQYLYDFNEKWNSKRILITQENARAIEDYKMYDKILVDVPCTNDRHSLTENDNNIFKSSRIKERLKLPELQASILTNCIRLLKPGGSLVYSTCTLSPIQNDGVVHMALSTVFREHNITVTVKDLTKIMQPFKQIFKFENSNTLKYGQLVVPFLPSNFGPMYFSKITRN